MNEADSGASALTASPNSVTFGSLSIGQTASSSVSLVNQGSAAVQITQANVAGQSFTVSGLGDLPITVAAGSTYNFNVNFSPAATGAATGQLTITSDASSNGRMVIGLNGTGAAAGRVTLSSLSCTSSALLGSATDACTVTLNAAAGSGGLTVSLASNKSAITVPSTVAVPAGETSAGFTATASSVSIAQTVTLTATAGGVSESFNLQLGAAVPTLSVSAASVVFGNVAVNTIATPQPVTLTSTGTVPVVINAAALAGTGFTVSGITFPATLNPGQAATLNVEFEPTSTGAATGQLTITSNSSTGSSTVISLSGIGTAAPAALSALSCSSGAITGSGTDACTVALSTAAPSGGLVVNLTSSSSAVTVPGTVTIPAGAASAGFTAAVSSVATAQAVTMTASAGGAVKNITLQLNAAILALSINASSVAFGDVVVNTQATQPVTLTSTGTIPVTISGATLTGAGFALPGAAFPATLSPGQSATLDIEFDPTAAGAATGQLTIASNSSTNGTAVIGLSGTGTAATGATTYYVDNCVTVGNDANNGTSTSTPWLTIAHVNAHRYNPGDSILFQRTCTWREELIPPSSGNSGNPITFGAYGAGTAPVINGANLVTTWTATNSGSYYAPEPSTSTLGIGSLQVFEDGTRLTQETAGVSSLAPGQWYLNTANSQIFVYTITGNNPSSHTMEVSVRQDCIENGEYMDYTSVQNLTVKNGAWAGVTINNYWQAIHYISITGVTAEDNHGDGINVYGSPGSGYPISNVTISGNTTSGNGGPGIDVWTDGNTISNVSITGNTGHDDVWDSSAAPNSPNGEIHVYGPTLSGLTVEDNLAYNAGSALPNFKAYPNLYDIGSGIYIDTVPSNVVIAYNQVYNNNDDGIAIEDTQGAAIYGNLSYNNGVAGFSNFRLSSNNLWYNNTAYGNALGFQVWGGGTVDNQLINNIAVSSTANALIAVGGGENDGTNGYGNVYIYDDFGPQASSFIQWGSGVYYSTYSSWEVAAGNCGSTGCSHSVETTPLFVSTSTNNFALAPSSPGIDAGLNLGSTYQYGLDPASAWPSNVILDNQNNYGLGWDIGAYVYTQTSLPQSR